MPISGVSSNSLIIGGNGVNENYNGDWDEIRVFGIVHPVVQVEDGQQYEWRNTCKC